MHSSQPPHSARRRPFQQFPKSILDLITSPPFYFSHLSSCVIILSTNCWQLSTDSLPCFYSCPMATCSSNCRQSNLLRIQTKSCDSPVQNPRVSSYHIQSKIQSTYCTLQGPGIISFQSPTCLLCSRHTHFLAVPSICQAHCQVYADSSLDQECSFPREDLAMVPSLPSVRTLLKCNLIREASSHLSKITLTHCFLLFLTCFIFTFITLKLYYLFVCFINFIISLLHYTVSPERAGNFSC